MALQNEVVKENFDYNGSYALDKFPHYYQMLLMNVMMIWPHFGRRIWNLKTKLHVWQINRKSGKQIENWAREIKRWTSEAHNAKEWFEYYCIEIHKWRESLDMLLGKAKGTLGKPWKSKF